jgi:hypothetical protein
MATIAWVDSDPNIKYSATYLTEKGHKVFCFNETQDCLDYLKKDQSACCIITSMMERGGRKERGLKNAFAMVSEIKDIWNNSDKSYRPILVMITLSADEQECKDNGFDVIVYGDRSKMQKIVSELLSKNRFGILNRKWWSDSSSSLPCGDLKKKAIEFLKHLSIPSELFDQFGDRCFCEKCEPKKIWYRGNPSEKYVLPTNWFRFGIEIRNEYLEKQASVKEWNVAYHGTKVENVYSIIRHHRILFPGDKKDDGTIIPICHGSCFAHHFNGPVIYLSPSIKYASQDLYSKPYNFQGHTVKVAFQCRVRPGSFKKFRETLEMTEREIECDEEFSNSQLEWVTDDKTAVVPYGLLIKFLN